MNQYVEEAKIRYEKTNPFRHDVKINISIVKELVQNGNIDAALKYMSDMENLTADMSFPVSTNNPVLDILIGNMSVVGPRPERVEHVEKYVEEVPEFTYRMKVKGGLTGYAQIYGKYNTSAYDKLKLDLMYIQNYSILLDLRLILMTVKIMFIKDSTEGFEEIKPSEKKD